MRVTCNTLNDFITNLRMEPPTSVLQQTVHVSVTERPLDISDKHKAVKFSIMLQASAVITLEDGGQYLLEYGEDCGMDYRDSSNELLGTERTNGLRKKLVEFCDDYGLKIRPGIVQI